MDWNQPSKLLLFYTACLLLLLSTTPIKAQSIDSKDTIRVIILKNFPPQFIMTSKGPSGLAVEMIREVARRASLNIEFVPVESWKEVYAALENGSAVVMPNMGISEARKKIVEFTDPYEVFDIKIFTRRESQNIKSIDDLKGGLLGVQETNVLTKGLIASRDYQIKQYPSFKLALLGLLSGEVDAVPAPTEPFLLIARGARLDERIHFVGPSLLEVKRAIALPKGQLGLRDKLNSALREFKQTDGYKNLLTTWYGSATPYWTAIRVVILVGTASAVLLCLMGIWRYYSIVGLNRRIRGSEDRFRDFAEISSDWLWEMDANLKTTYISALFFELTGFNTENVYKYGREVLLDPEVEGIDGDKWQQFYSQLERREPFRNFEYHILKPNNEQLIISSSGTPVFSSGGDFIGYRGIGTDITERKKIELNLAESEKKFRAMYDNAPDMYISVNPEDGRVVLCNETLIKKLGYGRDEIIGRPLSGIYHEDSSEAFDKAFELFKRTGAIRDVELSLKLKNGSRLEVSLNADAVRDETGKILYSLSSWRDITERKKIEEDLLTQSQIVINMVESASLTRSSDGIIVYTNPSMDKMFGYEPGELLGKHTSILHASTDVSPEESSKKIIHELNSHGVWSGDNCYIKMDGTIFWCSVNISTFNHPAYGEVWVSINADSSERRQAEEKLNYQASHDNLTGLINRREFELRAERLISSTARGNEKHAMCFMDLDQFKVVNDTCGHTAGDELLRQLGQVLQNSVRRRDTLARLGGDEFGVLMEHCSLEQAQRATDALLKKVDDFQFSWEGQPFRVSASIGLVAITESTGNFTELLKQADAACYMAKDQGRNRIHVYHPEDTELAQRHGEMQWVARINQALKDNRLTLYAQSIVPLDKSIDMHYEILLRMIDEDGSIIPPGSFLPSAERYDLIDKIDAWVIGKAFELMASNPAFVEQIGFVSINLSGLSLTNENFLDTVIAQIKEHQINAKKICFEITETAAISNLNAATLFISTLKELGCHFALDDFGSGLSSFGYLKNLPVDYLKIDGMFVKDIIDDPISHAMVKSINEIGHVMGMKTIAEFVENDAIKEMLIEIGVDYAQGYGIGKPKPFLEILKLLN